MLQDLPQTQLPLTRPSGKALEEVLLAVRARAATAAAAAREEETKTARDFLRKERRKMLF